MLLNIIEPAEEVKILNLEVAIQLNSTQFYIFKHFYHGQFKNANSSRQFRGFKTFRIRYNFYQNFSIAKEKYTKVYQNFMFCYYLGRDTLNCGFWDLGSRHSYTKCSNG